MNNNQRKQTRNLCLDVVIFLVMVLAFISALYLPGEGITGASVGVEDSIGTPGDIGFLAVPVVGNVTLNSSSSTNTSAENLTLYFDITDSDADDVKNITNWKLNGSSITVLNMPFENASANFSGDYSGFENNATFQNATWNSTGGYDGKGAFEFDGVEGGRFINISLANTPLSSAFSFSFWFKAPEDDQLAGTRMVTFSQQSAAGLQIVIDGSVENRIRVDNSGGPTSSMSDNLLHYNNSQWHHITVTRDSTPTYHLYMNGNLAGTSGGTALEYTQLYLGSYNTGTVNFNGTIDEVLIFNRSLTPEQVLNIYNNKTYLLDANETSQGDTWSACVIPNDGTKDGTEVCSSNNLTIYSIPTQGTPTINSTWGNNTTDENLTVYNFTSDPDGDAVKNTFNWYLNGSSITVLNMPFENASGNQSGDYSGFGNNATFQNATWNITGGYDSKGAFEFNGVNNYLDCGGKDSFNVSELTISVWFKTNQITNYGAMITGGSTSGADGYNGYGLYISNSGKLMAYIYTGTNTENILAGETSLQVGKWHHGVMTYKNSNLTIYLDGVKDNSSSASGAIDYVGGNRELRIGRIRSGSYLFYWNGTMDDLTVFNRSLSEKQVLNLYNNRTDLLDLNETSKKDRWSACITPNDGRTDGLEACSSNLTVVGDAPTATSVNITSSDSLNRSNGTLTGSYTFSDTDGDTETDNDTQWYNDSELVNEVNGFMTIHSNNLTKGQSWIFSVRVFDDRWSDWANSSAIQIENSVPSQENLAISSSPNELNLSTENLTITFDLTDSDGDYVKNLTNWKLNGTKIILLNMPFENTSNNQSGDYSGFENNATFQNATWNSTGGYDGRGAFEFDGVEGGRFINISLANTPLSSDFTLSYWFKAPTVNQATSTRMLELSQQSTVGLNIVMDGALSNIVRIDNSGGPTAAISTARLYNDSQWHHIIVSRDSTPIYYLYVDGGYVGASGGTAPEYVQLYVGSLSTGTVNFNGTIDDVMIFNRSLSAEQIKAIYENRTHILASSETSLGDNWSACNILHDGESESVESCSENLTITSSSDITIGDSQANITLTDTGNINSLNIKGQEQHSGSVPVSLMVLNDDSTHNIKKVESLGSDLYRFSYIGHSLQLTLNITKKENYFVFNITNVAGTTSDVDYIEFFSFAPTNIPENNRSWVLTTANITPFLQALPLDTNTISGNLDSGYYGFMVSQWLNFNGGGVLLFANKSEHFKAMEGVISDFDLINTTIDGEWFRNSSGMRESYLFGTVTNETYQNFINYAKTGNFQVFLLLEGVMEGSYNTTRSPTYFSNQSVFYDVLDEFISEGIKVGLHTYLNKIHINDSLLQPINESIYKKPVSNLTSTLTSGATTFTLDANASNNSYFSYYDGAGYTYSSSYVFIIDAEAITCSSYSDNVFSSCSRGQLGTSAAEHSAGTMSYIAPYYLGFFTDSNSAARNKSIDSFKEFADRFNLSLFYFDGAAYAREPNLTTGATEYEQKFGVIPYIENLNLTPPVQFGDNNGGSYGKYIQKIAASGDGVVYNSKSYTEKWKLTSRVAITNGPYAPYNYEFGWWKINGANFSSGIYDYDATTIDDIDYVMTKSIALDTSTGIQFGDYYTSHSGINKIFNRLGLYNGLINEDIANTFIPSEIKNHLNETTNEAEISNASGQWNLIEKKVDREYAAWNTTENYSYNLSNPFTDQDLKIEIRPRFDYYEYDDSRHTLASNLLKLNSSHVERIENPALACNVTAGIVTVNNSGGDTYLCKIAVPNTTAFDYKRGIGVSVTGDNEGVVLLAVIEDGLNSYRDFYAGLNFSGQRDLLLGNPGLSDEQVYDLTFRDRYWSHDHSRQNDISLYIFVDAGENRAITFHSLKALQEKGDSMVVDPTITIGGNSVTFPVNLSVNDTKGSILEYNGYDQTYTVYTPNYAVISTGTITTDNIVVANGVNEVTFSSDTSDSEYAARADIRITVNDDPDNDTIPTNGTYTSVSNPCNGARHFCDDNCPDNYNPTQADSDGDGVGDTCDEDVVSDTPTGHGSPSSASQATPPLIRKHFDAIQKNTPLTVFPPSPEVIRSVEFQTTIDLSNQQVTINRVTSAPASSSRTFHSFFQIEAGDISSNLKEAKISFQVERDWLTDRSLESSDIALYRWDGESWNELSTAFDGTSGDNYLYSATTDSFSYFAIGVKEIVEETAETSTSGGGKQPTHEVVIEVPPTPEQTPETVEEVVVKKIKEKPEIKVDPFLVIVLVMILVFCSLIYLLVKQLRRKKVQKIIVEHHRSVKRTFRDTLVDVEEARKIAGRKTRSSLINFFIKIGSFFKFIGRRIKYVIINFFVGIGSFFKFIVRSIANTFKGVVLDVLSALKQVKFYFKRKSKKHLYNAEEARKVAGRTFRNSLIEAEEVRKATGRKTRHSIIDFFVGIGSFFKIVIRKIISLIKKLLFVVLLPLKRFKSSLKRHLHKKKQTKTDIYRKEISEIKTKILAVVEHQEKVRYVLGSLDKWLNQGKISLEVYKERRKKLLKLNSEYKDYLRKLKDKIEQIKREIRHNKNEE